MSSVLPFFSRDQVKSVKDITVEVVTVPEWGCQMGVRTLSGLERDEFDESITIKKKEGKKETREVLIRGVRAKLVARTAVVPDGDPIEGQDAIWKRAFSDEDQEWLQGKSGAALQRLSDVAMRLAGLTDDEVEKLGNASAPGPSGDSLSA
jgi:hypothetical protein